LPRLRRKAVVLTQRVELPESHAVGQILGALELPRIRSGFRLQAATPAKRLNFDSALLISSGEKVCWRFAQGDREERGAKKHMFPQGAFVKMYYFAIEARERVGYTLAALR
jgi:hypothetical protein